MAYLVGLKVNHHTEENNMKKWIVLVLMGISQLTSANWQLDNAASKLNFVSTKKGTVAEVHTFKQLAGSIDASGHVYLSINLASVDTAIPIRDERMQAHLFESTQFPSLNLSAMIDAEVLAEMPIGTPIQHTLETKVSLHGIQKTLTAEVLITKLNAKDLLVTSYTPLIINAASFKLTAGVDKLRELAKLPSISYAVPVTFTLRFKP